MRGLRGRLVVGVVGAAIVAGAIAFVLFVIWQLDEIRVHQGRWLTLEAEEQVHRLFQMQESDWPATVSAHSREGGLEFTLVGSHGENHSSGETPFATGLGLETKNLEAGYLHASVELHGQKWLALVASWPVSLSYEEIYATCGAAFMVLILWILVLVSLTMVFYRRLVIKPVERLKELVGRGDTTALSQFGEMQSGDFGFLSRGIIAMNQKMTDDSAQLSKRLQELTLAQGQLVRAERLAVVGQLAAGVAHEVGNPLTVVSGYVDMMAAGELEDGQQARALESMARELERMNRTIRDLLDFSRDETVEQGDALILDVVAHVERLLRAQSQWRRVEIESNARADPFQIQISPDKLVQLLLNLCLNACAAMRGQGKLRVTWTESKGSVEIYVDDSGPGVPEAQRQEIFEPFFTTRKAGEGTGLGLSVCENIVSRHGGKIWVEDSPLGGARFAVSFALSGGERLQDAQRNHGVEHTQ